MASMLRKLQGWRFMSDGNKCGSGANAQLIVRGMNNDAAAISDKFGDIAHPPGINPSM
jgi:hypothetical protein